MMVNLSASALLIIQVDEVMNTSKLEDCGARIREIGDDLPPPIFTAKHLARSSAIGFPPSVFLKF